MDTILVNSQATLAVRQRELCKQTKFHLPPDQDLNLATLEREQSTTTDELYNLTRSMKKDWEFNKSQPFDKVGQIQQKKMQLLVAERQFKVAERQIQIVQGHILNIMNDEQRSGLSRQADLRRADDFKKQTQPLLTESAELLKRARHAVTFAELGARQRVGSGMADEEPSNSWDHNEVSGIPTPEKTHHSHHHHHRDSEVDEWNHRSRTSLTPVTEYDNEVIQNNKTSPSPFQQHQNTYASEDATNNNLAINMTLANNSSIMPMHGQTTVVVNQNKKKRSGCCCCLLIMIPLLILAAIGAGVYLIFFHYDLA